MRKSLLFAAIIGLLSLTGCPQPITLKTINLNPSDISWGYQSQFSQNAACDFPLPGQGSFLNGLGPETLQPGEVDAGWEDIFDQGAQPFPCQEEQQTQYRGHVRFDLSQFDSIT